jgi:SNF2 family DNA or RNA helicase
MIVKLNKLRQVLSGFLMPSVNRVGVCDACPRVADCVREDVQPGRPGCVKAVKVEPYEPISLETGKIALLEEDLEDCRDEKLIIWAWYRHDLARIKDLLCKRKIPFVSAGDRDSAFRFEDSPDCRVFVGQTKQGVGITLNSATCMVYYSHGFDLEARLQSMDRNHRIGQTKPVLVKDYICKGTIEEDLVWLLDHKRDVKDFMQTSVDCFLCGEFTRCREKGISSMRARCAHHDARLASETKRKLALAQI